ncbi:hypothetical protein BDK51DRAFT_41391 [Blyttiomyces helicus]|uniref:Uncharacterized protein n=1 Tax=Blyttiomyces helicus TaxID=388810 RepID=A0A4P9WGW6_9FUNG|nr:hypothetical protein BDK51DRAFT_41391 [Blyttiomyces helicus]|eukprot:RKO89756.1 hypothetical protein BDK51DRAFT_41391 [Blyttiomyces helicus]
MTKNIGGGPQNTITPSHWPARAGHVVTPAQLTLVHNADTASRVPAYDMAIPDEITLARKVKNPRHPQLPRLPVDLSDTSLREPSRSAPVAFDQIQADYIERLDILNSVFVAGIGASGLMSPSKLASFVKDVFSSYEQIRTVNGRLLVHLKTRQRASPVVD